MNVSSKCALGAVALLVAACGDHSSQHEPEVGGDGDAGEPETDGGVPVGYYLPSSLYATWGSDNILGRPVSKDEDGVLWQVDGETCMKGPMQITKEAKPGMRLLKLDDPDETKLRAALATPSGDDFAGREAAFKDFYAEMTTDNSTTLAHVHSIEAGTLSFVGTPTKGPDTCETYALREHLGARYVVGLKLEFANARSLKAFRAKNPGMTLEEILRHGSTSTPITFDDESDGLKTIAVVLARMGGELGGGLPEVHLACAHDNLRACARMVDELDAFASDYLAAFPPPTVEKLGMWSAVRTDIAKPPAEASSTSPSK